MDTDMLVYLTRDMSADLHIDADVCWSHEFFDSCARCGSLNTTVTKTTYIQGGVQSDRMCNACGYNTHTEVIGDDDYWQDDDYIDEFSESLDDCYMMPDGYCGAAGSEYCDWDCPFNR